MAQILIPTPVRLHQSELAPSAAMRTIRIMGVDFAAMDEQAVISAFVDSAAAQAGRWVVTANLDHLRRFAGDPATRELIGRADFVVADGAPIVLASRIAGMPLPERVAGSSMVLPIARRAAAAGASMFLLGGEPGVAIRARAVLEDAVPGIRIVGTSCPPAGFDEDPAMIDDIERMLLAARPDIVLLALGFPKQDKLIVRLREILPGASFMGVGISLSYLVGDKRRAPAWMRAASIEWLHRLVGEPRRLWRRYLLRGLPFAARLAIAAVVARVQRNLGGPWFAHTEDGEHILGAPKV